MDQLPKKIIKETKEHRNKIYELQKGNIAKPDFKKYLSSMGIYEERIADSYMLRIRISAGIINIKQLSEIAEIADLYGNGHIYFTTRQDIQFHNLHLEDTANIIEKLLPVNLISKGTGGNTVRNIACSPLSGVALDEVFDVTEYAVKAVDFLTNEADSFTLPRKFKIGFSNSISDTANAAISDLGFIAKIKGTQKGFEVYGAGGLGKNPNIAIKLEDFIPEEDFLYHILTMKKLFSEEGDRSNRNKARLRYVLYRLGENEFKNKYYEKLNEIKNIYSFQNTESSNAEPVKYDEKGCLIKNLLFKQKQGELYSVYIHPESGNISTNNLKQIIKFIKNLDYELSIRLTNTQGFFVRDLKRADAEKLIEIISSYISRFDIDNSISCVGSGTCKIGICDSKELLSAIKAKFKDINTEIKSQLPKIYISGCPNSCGQHQIGKIGFSGKLTRIEGSLIPTYSIYFGGNIEAGKTVFARSYGEIPAENIPDFLYELAKLRFKKKGSGTSLTDVFSFPQLLQSIGRLHKLGGDCHQKNYSDFIEFLSAENESVIQLLEQFTYKVEEIRR